MRDYVYEEGTQKVAICVPTISYRPYTPFVKAFEESIPYLDALPGVKHAVFQEAYNPYISNARGFMLRRALDWGAQHIVFLDHDMSWTPESLCKLIQTPGHIVCGTYRYKTEEERYMGVIFTDEDGYPQMLSENTIAAKWVPAGFLKITNDAVDILMRNYPELVYGTRYHPYFDAFQHGAHEGMWYGEDYAFSRRWNNLSEGGGIHLVPDLDVTHWKLNPDGTYTGYPGNYHQFLKRQPGGAEFKEQS